MAKRHIFLLSVFSAFCAVAGSRCNITETELQFPTYGFSDPDPVAHTESPLYPYFRFDGSVAKSTLKKWKAVILENEKIKVTMLPEIGGKVWGALDKATGREFIYFNHVVKFRDIAMRGPWCSGGIEFNFGVLGHAPSAGTPVDWCLCCCTLIAPALWPIIVTLSGSPPNAEMLSFTHCIAVIWSYRP